MITCSKLDLLHLRSKNVTRKMQHKTPWPHETELVRPTPILGLQPRDTVAMLVINTTKIISKNLHETGVQFSDDRYVFVLDHQHGCHGLYITYKPATLLSLMICEINHMWTDVRRICTINSFFCLVIFLLIPMTILFDERLQYCKGY